VQVSKKKREKDKGEAGCCGPFAEQVPLNYVLWLQIQGCSGIKPCQPCPRLMWPAFPPHRLVAGMGSSPATPEK